MKEIVLYRNKGTALVDDADYNLVSKYKWHLDRGYAARTISGKGIEYMHRMINKTPQGFSTDHINGNKLDNTRRNLRTCTQSLNNANSQKRKDNTTGHRGVVWHKRNQKWQAQITYLGGNNYLGQFDNKKEAITAYKRAACSIFGEFTNVHI